MPIDLIVPSVLPVEDRLEAMAHTDLLRWNERRLEPAAPVVWAGVGTAILSRACAC